MGFVRFEELEVFKLAEQLADHIWGVVTDERMEDEIIVTWP